MFVVCQRRMMTSTVTRTSDHGPSSVATCPPRRLSAGLPSGPPAPAGHAVGRRLLPVIVALLCLAGLLLSPTPAHAQSYDPPRVLTPEGCHAHVVGSRDGVVRGLASCNPDATVLYLELRNGRWTSTMTGWRGYVLAVAEDGGALFALFRSGSDVLVARRTHGGREYSQRNLGPHHAVEAGIVARDGRWHAVWRAYFPPGNEPDHLWQAGTLYPGTATRPITSAAATDVRPALGLGPRGRLVLAWERWPEGGTSTAIRVASTADGSWTSRQLSAAGERVSQVALASDADATTVAWLSGQKRQLRLHTLFAPGGSRQLTWGSGLGSVAVGGAASSPTAAVSTDARKHLAVRPLARGWAVDDITIAEDEYAESVTPTHVVAHGTRLTIVYDNYRSDPDPDNQADLSRALARTSR